MSIQLINDFETIARLHMKKCHSSRKLDCSLDALKALDYLVPSRKVNCSAQLNNPIKVIDLFSGPGGLGEGFSSVINSQNSRVFKIAASMSGGLCQNLFALKKANSALWNGKWGARMLPIHNSNSENVLSFVRSNKIDKVVGIFNLSAEQQTVRLLDSLLFECT